MRERFVKSKQWAYAIVGLAVVAILVAAYFVFYGGNPSQDAESAQRSWEYFSWSAAAGAF